MLVAVALLLPTFGLQPAAAVQGINATMEINGDPDRYADHDVLEPGDTLTLRVQYDSSVGAGTSVTFRLDEALEVTGVPGGNDAIESVTQDGNEVTFTFRDPWPAGVQQGLVALELTVDEVERSDVETISWWVDGEEQSITVIVRTPGDEFADVTSRTAKDVAAGNLNGYLSVVDGEVTLDEAILNQNIRYTLTLHSDAAANDFPISDELPAGFGYVADSFEANIVEWDEYGLNRAERAYAFSPTIDGNSFSGAVSTDGPFELALTYDVRVTDREALEEALQAEYERVRANGGRYEADFTNTATFDDQEREATISIGGRVEPLNPSAAFGKDASDQFPNVVNWDNWEIDSPVDAEGNFLGPIDVEYTITADLSQFDGTTDSRTLNRNVVIVDVLDDDMSWGTGEDFIVAEGISLREATDVDSADAFAGDNYVGSYWVDGQTLRINVGRDVDTDATFTVQARIDTLEGRNTQRIDGDLRYTFHNGADFYYGPETPFTDGVDVWVVEPGVDIGAAFSKGAEWEHRDVRPNLDLTLDPPVDITYTLRANLALWAGVSPDTVLGQNVVIVDELIEQMSWNTGDADFITANGITLEAADENVDEENFASDAYAGTYWVDGQVLRINLGRNTDAAVSVEAKARINTVANLTVSDSEWNTTYAIPNSADFHYRDGDPATRTVTSQITAPGANPGQAFAKSAGEVDGYFTAEDGSVLDSPADVVYTLTANLAQWVGDTPGLTLGQNVVIEDTLGAQASWATDVDDFFTAEGMDFEEATGVADAEAFAGDEYVGQYWVDGNTLRVNIGQDETTAVTIDVRARIESVDGLPAGEPTTIVDGDPYRFDNTATFKYGPGTAHEATASVGLIVVPSLDQGVNDPQAFAKEGQASEARVLPGETITVDYTFTLAAGEGVDLRESRIVDHIDTQFFDMDELAAVAGVSGSYDGRSLDASHFTLSTDVDGNLVIELSDAGVAVVSDRGADRAFSVTISLTTLPFDGKETKRITNRAVLLGEGDVPYFWSEDYSESTSYGDEAEVRKTVLDPTDEEWVETLLAETDDDGNVVQERFTYRVEFIPHGSYNNVTIIDVVDELPDEVGFLGFVDAQHAADPTDEHLSQGPVDIGGNLEAVHSDGTVTIRQKAGTRLVAGQPIAAYFAVELDDDSEPVTNTVSGSDATIVPLRWVAVGDYVWLDTNRDGLQNDGGAEAGIPGVVLRIEGPDGEPVRDVYGNLVGPETTDADGKYWFGDLPLLSGDEVYTVVIDRDASAEALDGLVPTIEGAGDDRVVDSSTWSASSEEGLLTEHLAEDPRLDFGFVVPKVSVGDFVWWDTNRDGIQDDGEPGIEGVTLTLTGPDGEPVTDVFGNVVEPTTTDEDGAYLFDFLPVLADGESYRVTVTAPEGFIPTIENPEAGRELDSSTGYAESEGLTENDEHDPTLDFGFVLPRVFVGDFVWWDTNRNGIQDDGEPGIQGVELTLTGPDGEPVTDIDGNPVGPTTTDENGFYEFVNLPVLAEGESYRVTVDADGRVPTIPGAGDDEALDSSTGYADSGDLTEDGDRDPTLDFGFVPEVSVGDYVWWDTNRDGIQDEGEPGIPGVTLTISRTDGEPVANVLDQPVTTTTTDADGYYSFERLPVLPEGERYVVTVTAPEGAEPTLAEVGDDRTLDSSTGSATARDLRADGERDPSLDFGFVPEVSVGDFVWWDTDRDGIQDDGEPGIEGVTLTISRTDGEPVENVLGEPVTTTVTNAEGRYSFDRLPVLPEDVYYVVTITAPEGVLPTVEGAGDDRGVDSSTGSATARDLRTNGDRDPTLDFGFVPEVSVGDFVWWDNDGDGIQDEGEPGIPGVTLTISRTDGEPVENVEGEELTTTTTDEDGYYSFDRLPVLPEDVQYVVTVTPPEGAVPSPEEQGDDRSVDSSTGSATARDDLRRHGDRDPSLDFGFIPKVSVGDFVWWDNNGDGIQDEGEPGIPGVVLTLTGPDGEPVTDVFGDPVEPTTTDEDGYYVFENLPVLPEGESYRVTITTPEGAVASPAEQGDDRGVDSSTGYADSGDLTVDGAHDPTLDFGFIPKVSVGDFVWWDNNGDGIQDEDEPGIPGVTLTLTGPDGEPVTDVFGNVVEPTTTDEDGYYVFENLPVLPEGESYRVTITPPEGAVASPAEQGADRGVDSSTGYADSGDLTVDGAHDPTLDFGFVPKVSVGDFVWLDTNGDGRQDDGEPGIPGVVLVLTGPDGQPVVDVHGNVVEPTVTDEDGYYSFDDLPVLAHGESYRVSIDVEASAEALEGLVPTLANVGDRAGDSDLWFALSIGLTTDGERDATLDFGFTTEPVVQPEPPTPTEPPVRPGLPATGVDGGEAAPLALAALLAAAVTYALVGATCAGMLPHRRHPIG